MQAAKLHAQSEILWSQLNAQLTIVVTYTSQVLGHTQPE